MEVCLAHIIERIIPHSRGNQICVWKNLVLHIIHEVINLHKNQWTNSLITQTNIFRPFFFSSSSSSLVYGGTVCSWVLFLGNAHLFQTLNVLKGCLFFGFCFDMSITWFMRVNKHNCFYQEGSLIFPLVMDDKGISWWNLLFVCNLVQVFIPPGNGTWLKATTGFCLSKSNWKMRNAYQWNHFFLISSNQIVYFKGA